MSIAHAILARALAATPAAAAAVGLWALLVTEDRLWGPALAHRSQPGRLLIVPFLALPHLVGLVAAALARRSARYGIVVLVGVAASCGLSLKVWIIDHPNRTVQVLDLLQTWCIQVLLCSLPIAGGLTAWRERPRTGEPE